MNEYIAVTISRQMGSGGTYIGYKVAKELGFTYVDREILRQAAKRLGRDESLLEECEEKSSSRIDNIIKAFSWGAPELTTYIPKGRPVYDRDLFETESTIITDIADRCDAVIIGRAGFYVLKNRPQAVHILIHAPKEVRVNRVMKASSITDVREARTKIDESDQRRAKFIRDMARTEWVDARNYHLCIDSSVAGLSASVQMIVRLVEKRHLEREAQSS